MRMRYAFVRTYKPVLDDAPTAYSTSWRTIAAGTKNLSPIGSAMAAFDYRQALEGRDAFNRHRMCHLFIGKSASIRKDCKKTPLTEHRFRCTLFSCEPWNLSPI
jgi:hypothetical protein